MNIRIYVVCIKYSFRKHKVDNYKYYSIFLVPSEVTEFQSGEYFPGQVGSELQQIESLINPTDNSEL